MRAILAAWLAGLGLSFAPLYKDNEDAGGVVVRVYKFVRMFSVVSGYFNMQKLPSCRKRHTARYS